MRDYGAIYAGFWANEQLRTAGDDARMLAAYLLTSPHTTTLGAFRLPDAYACEDLGWTSERFQNGLETVSRIGFIKYDPATKLVWIVKFLSWNKPANPNIWKAVVKMANAVPDVVPFKNEIMFSAGVSETVSKPLGNTPSPSPSPSPSPEEGVGETKIPLDDGSEFAVGAPLLAELRMAHPGIDVEAELRKARLWCLSNPSNRKTRRGVTKFLAGWIGRAEPPPKPAIALPGGGRRKLA